MTQINNNAGQWTPKRTLVFESPKNAPSARPVITRRFPWTHIHLLKNTVVAQDNSEWIDLNQVGAKVRLCVQILGVTNCQVRFVSTTDLNDAWVTLANDGSSWYEKGVYYVDVDFKDKNLGRYLRWEAAATVDPTKDGLMCFRVWVEMEARE